MKRLILTTLVMALSAVLCCAQNNSGKEYKATIFGIRSDGQTDNTCSIQYAIDFISAKGGGTLVFYVGRYLTGAVELKSNVSIRLAEASVIVGSGNIYNYKGLDGIFNGKDVENVSITGKGVIEGHHADKALISLDGCSAVRVEGLKFIGESREDIARRNCEGLVVEGVTSTADGTLPKWKTK